MLFDNLKEGFEKSIKEEIVEIHPTKKPQRMVIITDGFDSIEERVRNAESISETLSMELSKFYLHDFSYLFKSEEPERASIIENIKENSRIIKKLKDQSFIIILEETVRDFLIESRKLRKSYEEHLGEFEIADIEAIAEYLLQSDERKQNFLVSILQHLKEIKPQILSWKPPILEERDDERDPIGNFSRKLMRNLHKSTWVLFEGKKSIEKAQRIVCVVLGGQKEKEISDLATTVPTLIPNVENLVLTFLVSIKESEIKLTQMAIDEKNRTEKEESERAKKIIVEVEKDLEIQDQSEILDPTDTRDQAELHDYEQDGDDELPEEVIEKEGIQKINELLEHRYKSLIEPLRIEHQGVDFQLVIGDLHDLEVKLRKLDTDMVLIANKESGGKRFDDEIISISRSMIRNGITILIV